MWLNVDCLETVRREKKKVPGRYELFRAQVILEAERGRRGGRRSQLYLLVTILKWI
jgi:hypothetical protein